MRLRKAVRDFLKVWNHDWHYQRGLRVMGKLMDHMEGRGTPTAIQLDGLYRVIRWEGNCGTEAKLSVLRRDFPARVLRDLGRDIKSGCGSFGGGLGSIEHVLRGSERRRRFWRLLTSVRHADTPVRADAKVKEYLGQPVPGLGIAIVSSFLWAMQPTWYPVVNDGSREGLTEALGGFRPFQDSPRLP
ncbi:MAG: hypothetical protein E4G90_01955 [Gemmatimonadales bacterium]|nr:MAG: hypothetical protein E4G90_01955 [Gemmatimonadales bacterium]